MYLVVRWKSAKLSTKIVLLGAVVSFALMILSAVLSNPWLMGGSLGGFLVLALLLAVMKNIGWLE